MWGSTSLGRSGAIRDLKEQFHSGRTPGCQWSVLVVETCLQKPGTWSVHIDDGQIFCVPDDVFRITLIKRWRE